MDQRRCEKRSSTRYAPWSIAAHMPRAMCVVIAEQVKLKHKTGEMLANEAGKGNTKKGCCSCTMRLQLRLRMAVAVAVAIYI